MKDVTRSLAAHLPTRSRSKPPEATDVLKFKKGLQRAGVFLGGPDARFQQVGRKTLATMIDIGLLPTHRVLDIGAGSMRIGWWLLHYIEASDYYAIEPVRERLDTAAAMIGADINAYYNDDFTFPDVPFDFVMARSVWSHASKPMIAKMIAEFAVKSAPKAWFLASLRLPSEEAEDYTGEAWVGRVADDDEPGIIAHSPDWIAAESEKHGLTMEIRGELHNQTWILIRAGGKSGRH